MESLAYLHHALVYEEIGSEGSPPEFSWEGMNHLWRSSQGGLLALGIAVGIWGSSGDRALAVLKPGDRSPAVRQVQEHLQDMGYFKANPTGYFGEITRQAVIRFQMDQGLPADGVIGPKTQKLLIPKQKVKTKQRVKHQPPLRLTTAKVTPPPRPTLLNRGVQGSKVTEIQQRLQAIGFFEGEATGKFDLATESAVKAFQRDRSLSPDGIVGPATLAALHETISPAQVRQLQTRLTKGGFYEGSIDSIWGPETQAAVEAARDVYGVGIADIINGNY